MTPQERQLVAELFDRLARLESAPRDPEAERIIREGLARAPHALYPLVQTVLIQDEALRRADGRIHQLEEECGYESEPPRDRGFLDSMRDALMGRREPRGSVPSVRPGDSAMGVPAGFRRDMPAAEGGMREQPGRGGSFLGTAAAGAAGVIGGSLLLDSFRSMLGHGGGSAQAATGDAGGAERAPWGGDSSRSDLAREAGLDDIGRSGDARGADESRSTGLFGSADDQDHGGADETDAGGFFDAGFDSSE